MLAIGLMTGTSLDGCDVALCEIEGSYTDTKIKLLDYELMDMSDDLIHRIKKEINPQTSSNQGISTLDFELGLFYKECVLKMMNKHNLKSSDIEFVASHGQTIYHNPFGDIPSTLQIGQVGFIAYELGIDAYSNFRVMDVIAGGQGAPLVPYADYVMFNSKQKNIALQNLGGIGNVTYLKANGTLDDVIAFDTGPANMMIDEAMVVLYQKPYDESGQVGLSGKRIGALFNELIEHDYFKIKPPKSTGRELFGIEYTQKLLKKYESEKPEDIVNTLTEFTAYSIYRSYHDFLGEIDQIILSGGGAYNLCLIKYLKEYLPNTEITTQDALGFNNDAKEAMAFIILANETRQNQISNVKNATGAKDYVVLGTLTPGFRKENYVKQK